MTDFNNWKEITKGLYRYVIAANVCYEIHVQEWYENLENILNAKSCLYIVGEWRLHNNDVLFKRELLARNRTLKECMECAKLDDQENNS